MTDESVHQLRLACAFQNCSDPPAPNRPFCARHEAELARGSTPGLADPPEVRAAAARKADELERQWIEAEQAKEAERKASWSWAGPDPDTAQSGPGIREVAQVYRPDYVPTDPDTAMPKRPDGWIIDEKFVPADPEGPTAELLRYLRGEHGGIKRACAEAMVKGILEGLRAL